MRRLQLARDLASDQSDMHRNTWVASLSGGGSDGTWANALSLIERCLEIGPIPTELVEQFRKDMHLEACSSACGAGPMIALTLALATELWTAPAAAQQQERGCQPFIASIASASLCPAASPSRPLILASRPGRVPPYNADLCEHTHPGVQVSFRCEGEDGQ